MQSSIRRFLATFVVAVATSGAASAQIQGGPDWDPSTRQFGGGLEYRITRHIGITGDFSWNVVDGPHNNFGMVRSGLNFAF